ncbi:MAG: IS607 family transposase [Ruminobacter sp.]|uniref:Predicted site-specific integrase-resolvase n=2 Tax=Ruminobacter TaxID=866 RepID=A0A662ZH34_9GAMM|nr:MULTISPECIES: IS607 family transposase [Ruminobacter]MBQ3775500.1 IS607 family transposase [Ruminobacter sp.]SFP29639.1 Predicted site-specific integrase-resolvase [Ruminobacter amylophilus]
MNKIISIGQAAKLLGVHVQTLRNWEKSGKLKPDSISPGGTRRYNSDTIMRISGKELPQIEKDDRVTIAYARVSSQDQKEELKRQAQVLELYCAEHGYKYELITDLGSGMNYYKKGLTALISRILDDGVKRLVLTHKDRLLRFGAELIFSICEAKGVEVVIINRGEEKASFEEDFAKDVLEIITVFSARLYGSRSGKNRKIIEKLQESVK